VETFGLEYIDTARTFIDSLTYVILSEKRKLDFSKVERVKNTGRTSGLYGAIRKIAKKRMEVLEKIHEFGAAVVLYHRFALMYFVLENDKSSKGPVIYLYYIKQIKFINQFQINIVY
jgi:hypothetical protein